MRERSRLLRRVDGLLFGFAGAAAVWLAYLLARTGIRPGWPLLLLLPFWLLVTYLTLPRIHRILTFIYVPGYFIGRTRTSDGLLGDPVNLALRGSEAEVHAAMTAAGAGPTTSPCGPGCTSSPRPCAADTDVERDFIVASIAAAVPGTDVDVIKHFSSGFHARNGGGDRIETDGDLPVMEVGPSPDPPEAAAVGLTDSRDRRPAQTVFGAGVALVRSALFLLSAVAVFVAPGTLLRLTHSEVDLASVLAERAAGVLVAVVLLAFALGELGLGLATLLGHNWARLWLMGSAVATTVGAFASNLTGSERITLLGLPTTATAVLLLLALTSHRAREYADRLRKTGQERAATNSVS